MRAAILILALASFGAACKQKPTFRDAAPRPAAGTLRGTYALTYYWISAGLDGVLLDPRDFSVELPGLETAGAGRVRIIEAIPG